MNGKWANVARHVVLEFEISLARQKLKLKLRAKNALDHTQLPKAAILRNVQVVFYFKSGFRGKFLDSFNYTCKI